MIPAAPAATLVVMRDAPGRAPDLLMLERAGNMAFAPGAMVFPGGQVDPGDHVVAADRALTDPLDDLEDAAARVAAIRECIEEVGVAVGFAAAPEEISALRAGLHAGNEFGAMIRARGLRLDLAALTPFARWRPNLRETRVFDARFYIAEAPDDADIVADGGESVRAIWAAADHILAEADRGRIRVIFPTRRNLERLATFAGLADARSHAASFPVQLITPWLEERGGEEWLCIPDGLGYPVTSEPLRTAMRG